MVKVDISQYIWEVEPTEIVDRLNVECERNQG